MKSSLDRLLHHQKATADMQASMQQFHDALQCRLCHQMWRAPHTLPCSHTFCQHCIMDYSCNNWGCPVCQHPITVRGKNSGSFIKVNPSLQGVTTAYQNIVALLEQAPDQWWMPPLTTSEHDDGHDQNNNAPAVLLRPYDRAAMAQLAASVGNSTVEHEDDDDVSIDLLRALPSPAAYSSNSSTEDEDEEFETAPDAVHF